MRNRFIAVAAILVVAFLLRRQGAVSFGAWVIASVFALEMGIGFVAGWFAHSARGRMHGEDCAECRYGEGT